MPRHGVTGTERGVEIAPTPERGTVLHVEMDRVESNRGDVTHKQCQFCREPVDLEEPHRWAFVEDLSGRLTQHKRPVFCDQAC